MPDGPSMTMASAPGIGGPTDSMSTYLVPGGSVGELGSDMYVPNDLARPSNVSRPILTMSTAGYGATRRRSAGLSDILPAGPRSHVCAA